MSYHVTQMIGRSLRYTTSISELASIDFNDNDPYIIALNGTPEKLEQLFKEGINPDEIIYRTGRDKCIAFHILVESWTTERIGKIELFLKYGMNPNLKDEKGRTALVYLCYLGLHTDLHVNPWTNSEDLDEEQNKIEHRKRMFRTLIHLLISHGADPNISDDKGNTCLHYCINHDPFYFQIFEQYGAKRFLRNHKGKVPYDKRTKRFVYEDKEYTRIFSSMVPSFFDCTKHTIDILGVDISKLPPVFKCTINDTKLPSVFSSIL